MTSVGMDAEAQSSPSEWRPGGPERTSGDGAWAAPAHARAACTMRHSCTRLTCEPNSLGQPGSAEARRACSTRNTASCGFRLAGIRPLVCARHHAEPGSAEARRAWRISHIQDACSVTARRAKSSREETSAVPAVIAPCRHARCEQRSWSRPRHRSAAGSPGRGVIARRAPAPRVAHRAAVPSPP
jgi:hypothetical protein